MMNSGAALTVCAIFFSLPLLGEAKEPYPQNPLNPPGTLYWCPNRTSDQQIASTPESGCTLLVEKPVTEDDSRNETKTEDRDPIQLQTIQHKASKFLRDYRRFLDCCASDVDALDDLHVLQTRAADLLMAIQETGFVNTGTKYRGITLREIIPPIAQARDDLRKLKKRLDHLGKAKERLQTLDYDEAGRERRRIEREEDLISKEFHPARPPDSAPTGTEIESTTLRNRVGPNIEATTLPNASGSNIGDVDARNSDQSNVHPLGRESDMWNTTLPNRSGTDLGGGNTPATDLPTSVGSEIDSPLGPTGPSTNPARVGPSVGNSTLNHR